MHVYPPTDTPTQVAIIADRLGTRQPPTGFDKLGGVVRAQGGKPCTQPNPRT